MKISMISIVIPTYNEKGNIEVLLASIHNVFKHVPKPYEVIVVDDNSPDKTADIVKKIARRDKHVRLKLRRGKRGLGESIADGIKMARGDSIIGMDADMNHDPAHIPQLIDALSDADLVVGSRFVIGGGMADWMRFLMSGLFNCMLRAVFGFPIWDNTSGYYAVKRKTLREVDLEAIYFGYGEYHLRLVYTIMRKGLHVVEVPVFYKKRQFGQSKSRLFVMIRTYTDAAMRLQKHSR